MLEGTTGRPPSVLCNERRVYYSFFIERVVITCLLVRTQFLWRHNCGRTSCAPVIWRVLIAARHVRRQLSSISLAPIQRLANDNASHWSGQLLELDHFPSAQLDAQLQQKQQQQFLFLVLIQVQCVVPILPLVFPFIWRLLEFWGTAKIVTAFQETLKHEVSQVSSPNLQFIVYTLLNFRFVDLVYSGSRTKKILMAPKKWTRTRFTRDWIKRRSWWTWRAFSLVRTTVFRAVAASSSASQTSR